MTTKKPKRVAAGPLGDGNPVVLVARQRKAGPMRDRRARGLKERTRRELSDW